MNRAPRTRINPGASCAGTQTSVAAGVNARGITPTTVWPRPPNVSRAPIAAGLRAKRRVQSASLIRTAVLPPKRSSSAANVRPSSGRMPNTSKKRGSTRRPSRRSGSTPLVSVTFSV